MNLLPSIREGGGVIMWREYVSAFLEATMTRLLVALVLVLCSVQPVVAADWPLLFADDFESGDLSRWQATDPTAWKWDESRGGHAIHQFKQSVVATPVRSPFNRAIARGVTVRDFQLDVDVQSTARDYPHRSLCLVFGYQDPSHFYYVHLGQKTDDHANQVFIVNSAPRTKISLTTTAGTPWDDQWHHVRIRREVSTGDIAVYFDNLDQPAMTARDKTFDWGAVGIGSFDDTGRFDQFELRGVSVGQ